MLPRNPHFLSLSLVVVVLFVLLSSCGSIVGGAAESVEDDDGYGGNQGNYLNQNFSWSWMHLEPQPLEKVHQLRKGQVNSISENLLKDFLAYQAKQPPPNDLSLVMFWAPWQYKILFEVNRTYDAVAEAFPTLWVCKVDTSTYNSLNKEYSVSAFPTFLIFRGSQLDSKHYIDFHKIHTSTPGGPSPHSNSTTVLFDFIKKVVQNTTGIAPLPDVRVREWIPLKQNTEATFYIYIAAAVFAGVILRTLSLLVKALTLPSSNYNKASKQKAPVTGFKVFNAF